MLPRLYILFVLVSISHALFSQDTSTVTLGNVVIKHEPVSLTGTKNPSPSYVIRKDFIYRVGANDVGSALKFMPNLQIKDYGGAGGIRTVSFRSLGSSHTGVVLDGNIQPNLQAGTINLTNFQSFGVHSVIFTSGQPSSNISPASAYIPASVVTVKSDFMRRDTSFNIRLYQSASTINAYESGAMVKFNPSRKAQFGIQLFGKYGSGAYNYSYNLTGSDQVFQRSNSEILNYKARVGGAFYSDYSRLRYNVSYNRNEQQLPGAVILFNPSNDQKIFNEDIRADINFLTKANKHWTINATAFAQMNKTIYNDPSFLNLAGFLRSEYQQNTYSAGVIANRNIINDRSRYFFGSDLYYADLESNEFDQGPKRFGANSVFGTNVYFRPFAVEFNVNHQLIFDEARSADTTVNTVYSKFSPYVGITTLPFYWLPLRLRFTYKRAFRMPTFNDLYYNFIGNSNLQPEDAHLFNAGMTYVFNRKRRGWRNSPKYQLSISFDSYFNKVSNKIVAVPTKDLFNWSMQNIGVVKIGGMDITVNYEHKKKSWTWGLSGNYSFNRSVDITDPNGPSYGHQIPYTPVSFANVNASIGYRGWTLTSGAIYSGERYSLNQNIPLNYLDPFVDWSVGFSKTFYLKKKHQEIALNLNAMNLLNKNYEVIRSFPMPGRFYQLTLRYGFK